MSDKKIISIWFEGDEWCDPYDIYDSNIDVIFILNDNTKWAVSFFTYKNILSLAQKNKATGESLNGLYFCSTDMVLIENMSKDSMIKVIEDMIKKDLIELYCTKLDNDEDCE